MAVEQIQFQDKELGQSSPQPEEKKLTFTNVNEVKNVVNNNASELDLVATTANDANVRGLDDVLSENQDISQDREIIVTSDSELNINTGDGSYIYPGTGTTKKGGASFSGTYYYNYSPDIRERSFVIDLGDENSNYAFSSKVYDNLTATGTPISELSQDFSDRRNRFRILTDGTTRVEVTPTGTTISAPTSGSISVSDDIVNVSTTLRLYNRSISNIPPATLSNSGAIIYISDESGGATVAFSDGVDWRRVSDNAIVT